MRDYKRIKRRIDISLDRSQFYTAIGGAAVSLGLVFSLGLIVGRNTSAPVEARLANVPSPVSAVTMVELPEEPENIAEPVLAPAPKAKQKAEKVMVGLSQDDSVGKKNESIEPRQGKHKPDENKRGHRNPDKPRAVATSPAFHDHETVAAGHYTVQLSAYKSLPEATAFVNGINAKNLAGKEPRIIKVDLGAKGIWYRVRVGDFKDSFMANMYRAKLRDLAGDAEVKLVD